MNEEGKYLKLFKTSRMLMMLSFLAYPLGGIMWFFTRKSFGPWVAIVFGVLAAVIFWNLVRAEVSRMVGREAAAETKDVLSGMDVGGHITEVKRVGSAYILRVYLLRSQESLRDVRDAITERFEDTGLSNLFFTLQLSGMDSEDELAEKRKTMNQQLMEQVRNRKRPGGRGPQADASEENEGNGEEDR